MLVASAAGDPPAGPAANGSPVVFATAGLPVASGKDGPSVGADLGGPLPATIVNDSPPAPVAAAVLPGPVEPEVLPGPVEPEVLPGPVEPEVSPGPVEPEVLPGPVEAEVVSDRLSPGQVAKCEPLAGRAPSGMVPEGLSVSLPEVVVLFGPLGDGTATGEMGKAAPTASASGVAAEALDEAIPASVVRSGLLWGVFPPGMVVPPERFVPLRGVAWRRKVVSSGRLGSPKG